MTATIHPQDTAAPPTRTGPLTVPLEIIRAAGARHRAAVNTHDAHPACALAAVAAAATVLVLFAVFQWRPLGSPLLIGCTLIGAAAMFGPDVLAARTADREGNR